MILNVRINSIQSQMEYKRLYFILFQVKWNIPNGYHVISRLWNPFVTQMLFYIETVLRHHLLCISDKNTSGIVDLDTDKENVKIIEGKTQRTYRSFKDLKIIEFVKLERKVVLLTVGETITRLTREYGGDGKTFDCMRMRGVGRNRSRRPFDFEKVIKWSTKGDDVK